MTTADPGSGGTDEAAADDPVIDIRVLGPLEVSAGAERVALHSTRAQKLLALLAANADSVVPFERIVAVLWDDPPASARQQVHNVVGALRRSLGATDARLLLETHSAGYRLSVPLDAVDVFRFRSLVQRAESAEAEHLHAEAAELLQQALAEWRGPAFSGLSSRHFENSATLWDEQRLSAVERLAELQLRQDGRATQVSDLINLVAEYPFRESLRAVLMKVLHRNGRKADALAVFEEGRRILVDDLGLDPGVQLQAAHQLILADGPTDRPDAAGPVAREPGHRAPEADAYEPRSFLPRDIVEFTGREAELRQLMEHATRTGRTALVISGINGMGGVGKTTLAVHLAHRLAAGYPDGQYFVDLRGFTSGARPLRPAQALDLLLRGSGLPPELIPRGLAECSALWRSRLAGRRVLLLLDNALDVRQIRPLLPGTPGSLVLISSRHRMTSLEGAVPLALDVMPHPEALSLFRQIVGAERTAAEPEETDSAITLCGHLPLAIQIAAARLRDRPGWSVADLVVQLGEQHSRSRFLAVGDRNVVDVLAWSYRHLTKPQQRMFRLLSLHPGADFDVRSAAAVAGMSLDEAAMCLVGLFEANLLQQHTSDRYHFHDLVRDCSHYLLDRHADDAERAEATSRVLDHYLHSAHTWCAALGPRPVSAGLPTGPEPGTVERPATAAAAVRLLETEHAALVAAVRLAAGAGSHTRVWRMVCCLMPYFAHLSYSGETEELLRYGLRAARAEGDAAGESATLMGLGRAKRVQGRNAEARDLMSRAIELSERHGNRAVEILQRTGLGALYADDNLFEEARDCFVRAMDLAYETDDHRAQANLTNNLGVISRELGDLDGALRYFRRTLVLDEEVNAARSQVFTLCNVGQIMYLRGSAGEAAEQLREALDRSRALTDRQGEGHALAALCTVSRKLGDISAAFAYGREALEVARETELYDLEGDVLNAIGDAYLSLGHLDTAERLFGQARRLAETYGSARYLARADEGQAHILSARGDLTAARDLWRRALATYPGGVVNPPEARRHLDDPARTAHTCWRCGPGTPAG